MKIGVMLRHFGQPGGIGVYTANILTALLEIDSTNQYFLLYDSPEHLGGFADFPNVVEKVLRAPNKIWWDQLSVPRYAAAEGLDVIYNPKLSVPLFTRAKTILVMHGAEQFVVPWAFKWYDRAYFKIANRLFCRRASAVIAMTHTGAADIAKHMGADPRRIRVIYEAYNERCAVLNEDLTDVVNTYALPERFILFVGGLNPIKNLGNVLRAYHKVHQVIPHKLVITGFKRWKYSEDLELVDKLGLRDNVVFTGFVSDDEIPALYNLADLFVFPSLYEGFGIPVLEAMACGCPVIASRTGCSPEVAGGAAVLVDPYDPDEIADAIKDVLGNESLRRTLVEKGLHRARDFNWGKSAGETLALFDCVSHS